jgi:hypothetical protein
VEQASGTPPGGRSFLRATFLIFRKNDPFLNIKINLQPFSFLGLSSTQMQGDPMYRIIKYLTFLLLFFPIVCRADSADTLPVMNAVDAVVIEINAARTQILAQLNAVSSPPITQALINALKRGVDVEVIADKSSLASKNSAAGMLTDAGIPTYIDARHFTSRNKIILVIDHDALISGTFTVIKKTGVTDMKKILMLKGNKPKAESFIRDFEKHKAHSEAYIEKPAL